MGPLYVPPQSLRSQLTIALDSGMPLHIYKTRLYHVPGGSVGHKYVDLLIIETFHLAAGKYPFERLMVFSAILQHNRMVRKGKDIRRVLERHLTMWTNDEFDYLVEEAVKCDKSITAQTPRVDDNHLVTVFMRLILQGKVRAAMQ